MENKTFVYTAWDCRREENCHSILLVVKRLCEDFRELLISESLIQVNILDSLWEQSQRYLLLKRAVPSFTSYPQLITNRVEQEIFQKINEYLKEIHSSNISLQTSLKEIKEKIVEFENVVKTLDARCGSPFVNGSANRRPIYFYIEMLGDVYYYLRKAVAKLMFAEKFLDYKDPATIEVYKSVINRSTRNTGVIKFKLS